MPRPTTAEQLLRAFGHYGVALAGAAVGNVALITVLTNTLPLQEFGAYVLAIALISAVTAVASQWLQQSILRFLPGAAHAERVESLNVTLYETRRLVVIIACAGAVWILFEGISGIGRAQILRHAAMTLVAMASVAFLVLSSLLRAEGDAKRFSVLTLGSISLKLILIPLFVLLVARRAEWALLGSALATFLAVSICKPRAYRWQHVGSIADGSATRAKMWRYGKHYVIWFAASQSFPFIDRFMLGWQTGAEAVAVYGAYYLLVAGAIELFAAPLRYATHPAIVKAWEREDVEQVRKLIRSLVIVGIAGSLIGAGFAYVVIGWVVGAIMPIAYLDHRFAIPILWIALGIWHTSMFAHKYYELRNDSFSLQKALVLVALVHVGFQYLGARQLGILGASFALLTAWCLYFLWSLLPLLRRDHAKANPPSTGDGR